MRVVITGGTGFLGSVLTRRLLDRTVLTAPSGRPEPIDSIVLFDAAQPGRPGRSTIGSSWWSGTFAIQVRWAPSLIMMTCPFFTWRPW